jgi:hypothetical protein
MLTHGYNYEAALADSVKIAWQVNDLIGGDKRLDFSRPFLPERLAQVRGLAMLSKREQLLLNQIRGNSYLYLFGFVEEFILPFVTDEARASMLGGDPIEVRAMMTFAEEEAKHIHLFRRFAEEFRAGFRTPCAVVGPAPEVARAVLSHSRLGIALLTLHLEWMTQSHYLESVRDDQDLDPQFKSLLRHHWMEEAQHAKLDTLLVDKLAREGGPAAIEQAFADFAALCTVIDELLARQAHYDIASLEAAAERRLPDSQRTEIRAAQQRAYRFTFLASGLLTKNFLTTVEQLAPGAAEKMRARARELTA